MSPPARVLVVANRTADSEELRAVLLERFERGPIELTLLAPAAWEVTDPHGGTESARRRLRGRRWRAWVRTALRSGPWSATRIRLSPWSRYGRPSALTR